MLQKGVLPEEEEDDEGLRMTSAAILLKLLLVGSGRNPARRHRTLRDSREQTCPENGTVTGLVPTGPRPVAPSRERNDATVRPARPHATSTPELAGALAIGQYVQCVYDARAIPTVRCKGSSGTKS